MSDMECVFCEEEIEQDWSEHEPTPKCYGCAQAHQDGIDAALGGLN